MPHPPFEVLEHTADVGLKAYGATLPELFVNAARGMIALALEPQEVRPAQCRPLAARGEDLEELLVHFLSEILYALDAEGWQFSEFRIWTLEAAWCNLIEQLEERKVFSRAELLASLRNIGQKFRSAQEP